MWDLLVSLLQRHGWTIIGLLVLWYFIKDEVLRRLNIALHERSLREANRPERRNILEVDRQRVRDKQQQKFNEHSKRTAEIAASQQQHPSQQDSSQNTTTDTSAKQQQQRKQSRPPPTSINTSSEYLPLMGSGGGGGYRPRRRIRPGGGGG